jgi:alkyl hydroperoxide reductase subunit D
MTLVELQTQIKDYGRDLRLNLDSIMREAPGLTSKQIFGIALACAYSTQEKRLSSAIESEGKLSPEEIEAAKAAAVLMGMNNIYYRTMHILEDQEIGKMPAKLRMNIIANPGIDKLDFELYCIAVSALGGCEACVNSHVHGVKKAGMSNEGVHSAIRIAAIVKGVSQALGIN